MPLPDRQDGVIVRRDPRLPESTGRVLDTIEADGQRVVSFADWLLNALRTVNTILGVVVERNERAVSDPTDAILGDQVRVPRL